MKRSILFTILAAATILVFGSAGVHSEEPSGPIPGAYIIRFAPEVKQPVAPKSLSGSILRKILPTTTTPKTEISSPLHDYYLFSSADTSLNLSQVKELWNDNSVLSIEPEYYLEFFDIPNDPLFEHQWYLQNQGQQYYGVKRVEGLNNDSLLLMTGIAGVDIGMSDRYSLTPPTEHTKVVVGVVDTGIDLIHPDLVGRLWHNPDEIPDNGIDDDHNGYIDDVNGYDVSGDLFNPFNPIGDNDPTDTVGHGTHIAGIIGSESDNLAGVSGIANNVEIMGVKIRPNGTTSVGAKGIIYAVDNGAQMINISWGVPYESGIVKAAIDYAEQNNVLVFVAAGNNGDNFRYYPAAYGNVVTVGAINSSGDLTVFSSYGAHLDIVAPGQDILSLRATGTDLYGAVEPGVHIIGDDSAYIIADGTSMATPITLGAAAYIKTVRPDLSNDLLLEALYAGAVDLLDPLRQGDNLIGFDSLSGHGRVNVDGALAYLQPEGLAIKTPLTGGRYDSDVTIEALPLGGYSGSWEVSYKFDEMMSWVTLAQGDTLPTDNILYTITDTSLAGDMHLRITDQSAREHVVTFTYFRTDRCQLDPRLADSSYTYNLTISGSAYGPTYDSLRLLSSLNGFRQLITSTTEELFNEEIINWSLSGIVPDNYYLVLEGYYTDSIIFDSLPVTILSSFPAGWPVSLGTRGALSPVAGDLDNDDVKEIVIGTAQGLYVFQSDGSLRPGFPVVSNSDIRSIPALYDVDKDGRKEIIATDSVGIHVFNDDGSYVEGWPVSAPTGIVPLGLGYPSPVIARLGMDRDSAIVIINIYGDILAYTFEGESYFYSLGGFFASFYPRINLSGTTGRSMMPTISSGDFNDDGLSELLAVYSSPEPYSGIGVFDGRSGEPAYQEFSPLVLQQPEIMGAALANFDEDPYPEILTLGVDSSLIITLWLTDELGNNFPGWPVYIPEIGTYDFIGSNPILADLNKDMVPEILFTFMGFDLTYLFVFNADGTPYAQLPNAPTGAAYSAPAMFGIPAVADLVGDAFPEIILRSGHFFPGTGPEKIHMLDNQAQLVNGWPINTPANASVVLNTRYVPLIDDINADGTVEMLLFSDNGELLRYDFQADYQNGNNKYRYFGNNLNTNVYPIGQQATDSDDPVLIIPSDYTLKQNYPNPFNPSTTIAFTLAGRTDVNLTVFNIAGQKVTTLVANELPAGTHEIQFDGSAYASGVYLYRLETSEKVMTKKMVLIK